MSAGFPELRARTVIEGALAEDFGEKGDVTSRAVLPAGTRARARLVAREELVVAGLPACGLAMDLAAARLGGSVVTNVVVCEGERVSAGSELARFEGDALPILAAERTMLNLVARLAGIASLTARAVAEVAGTGARVSDTRKTTPLLRELEKYAVAVGGGENHRPGLDAQILVKDNHKEVLGGIEAVIERLRASGADLTEAEIEVETLAEFEAVVRAGVGWILLDNMTPEEVQACVASGRGSSRLEVSGGLRPGTLRPYAEAGVDRLSMGMLTHGARSCDLSLDIAFDLPGEA